MKVSFLVFFPSSTPQDSHSPPQASLVLQMVSRIRCIRGTNVSEANLKTPPKVSVGKTLLPAHFLAIRWASSARWAHHQIGITRSYMTITHSGATAWTRFQLKGPLSPSCSVLPPFTWHQLSGLVFHFFTFLFTSSVLFLLVCHSNAKSQFYFESHLVIIIVT